MLRHLLIALLVSTMLLSNLPPRTVEARAPATFTALGTFQVAGGAEIAAATPDGRYLALAGTLVVTLLDLANLTAPTTVCTFDPDGSGGGSPTSVAVHPSGQFGLVAVSYGAGPAASSGRVEAFSIPGCAPLWEVAVGIQPDSIVLTPDGRLAVVAIEDERDITDPTVCPAANDGRVDLVSIPQRPNGSPTVTTVELNLSGVAGVNCPLVPQPEGVAIDPQGRRAFVTLQENNALATINLETRTVESIISMGTSSHEADLSSTDNEVDDLFTGRRESDSIAISKNGKYLFTADEGDTRLASGIYSGGRTMTVLGAPKPGVGRGRRADPPQILTDTDSQIEDQAAIYAPPPGSRANRGGPEPEGITTFQFKGHEFAAVTLERSNALIIFDVSDAEDPAAAGFVLTGSGPEGVVYLPERQVLITANEAASPPSITIVCVSTGAPDCS